MTRRKEPLTTSSDWTFELIDEYYDVINKLADGYGLDCYPNQIEVINSEQMLDAYSSVGMPLFYNHWTFGQEFIRQRHMYQKGYMGLAYEIVINSNPCISYLMEENTMMMQILVMAHAAFGHNAFFKNNYLFKQWTDAEGIIDYLDFSKKYIAECEEKYGMDEVEELLDSCHALQQYGIDKYKHPRKLSAKQEENRRIERLEYIQSQVNELWSTIPTKEVATDETEEENFPKSPQENILYFVEKNAPKMEPWKREIIRIVRKTAQYFYPQMQTSLMNEGWACTIHYKIINELNLPDSLHLPFIKLHNQVVRPHLGQLNPYHLGFKLFERIIEEGGIEEAKIVREVHNDISFLRFYCDQPFLEDMNYFSYSFKKDKKAITIDDISDDSGWESVRDELIKNVGLNRVHG